MANPLQPDDSLVLDIGDTEYRLALTFADVMEADRLLMRDETTLLRALQASSTTGLNFYVVAVLLYVLGRPQIPSLGAAQALITHTNFRRIATACYSVADRFFARLAEGASAEDTDQAPLAMTLDAP